MNLAENLSRCAAASPNAPAIKLDDVVLSYSALDAASARVAGLLAARGVTAGDRVGIMLPNVPYFPVAYYGILRLGAVVVPMNVLLKGRETAFYPLDGSVGGRCEHGCSRRPPAPAAAANARGCKHARLLAPERAFATIARQATTRSTGMTVGGGFQELWPTPIGVHRYPDAATLNPMLVKLFGEGRAVQERKRGAEPKAFFASDDDLLHRVKIAEWQDFVRFLVTSLGETAKQANREAWAGQELELKVGIEGMWFQCSRNGAFHDVHTHGNCSWSSAYIVQIDDSEQRVTHPVYGAANGVTRLYGPPFTALAGASVDVGNAYLMPPHQDIEPIPGQLLLFPSWLAHQALPYDGEKERIIISFNASIHASEGDQLHSYSAH